MHPHTMLVHLADRHMLVHTFCVANKHALAPSSYSNEMSISAWPPTNQVMR